MSSSDIEHLNVRDLQTLPDEGPVVMLNFMRFREYSLGGNGTGWAAYLRYSALAVKLIKGVGGTIIWAAKAEAIALGGADRHHWDYAALVRYPSCAAFLSMMEPSGYAAANIERNNGCADHLIIATPELFGNFNAA